MIDPHDATPATIPLGLAADLQEHLLIACNDLERLDAILEEACTALMTSLQGELARLDAAGGAATMGTTARAADGLAAVAGGSRSALAGALSSLQFQDMASQLIRHTHSRLRSCADRLACAALDDDEGEPVVEPAPLRPNPVTQAEMDVGSVDLF